MCDQGKAICIGDEGSSDLACQSGTKHNIMWFLRPPAKQVVEVVELKDMSSKPNNSPKTLISYSHDSKLHKERVLALASRLRDDGIDCHIDQYEMSPKEGWPRWMVRQIEDADYVLVVCTEIYASRFSGKEITYGGLGAKWEGAIISQSIYEEAHNNQKFIPIIFSQEDSKFRPAVLRSVNYYNVGTEDGYEDLYRRLTNQPSTPKPELGAIRSLPPRQLGRTTPKNKPKNALQKPTPHDSAVGQADLESLVLLMNRQQKYQLVPSVRIESGTSTKLHLAPTTPHQLAFLAGLRDSYDKSVAVAFGIDAFEARVENITQLREGSKEIWMVTLQPEKDSHDSGYLEISFSGWSVDDIAELRARRILLNEQIAGVRSSTMDRLNSGLIEHYVGGKNSYIGDLHSPFPALYVELGTDRSYFLTAARIFAVLYLRLTGVVEHILKLDLTLQNEMKLSVKFEGQRKQNYANQEPRTIKLKGHCLLTDADDDDE